MARNPYTVLGVAPSATDSEIRAAFRKLAKLHHPDRNPGDAKSEDKFKEVSAAFDILGDAERRRRFDRGEIDADGRERMRAGAYPRGGPGAGAGSGPGFGRDGPFGASEGPGEFSDISDLFADLFGARSRDGGAGRGGFKGAPTRGRDLRYRLEVEFLEAALGARKRVTMPDGRTLDIQAPPGLEDGQTLRLRGQGEPGPGGGQPGDVYVEVTVRAHRLFERDGLDIHLEAPITLKEAVLGGKITVPTIEGDVAVTVPRGANSGTTLRLRGRGIAQREGATGDQFVKLKIMLPEGGDPELEAFVRGWSGGASKETRARFADV
ncbi:MAG: DnaJ domain-containing protein [Alphaproteobacteria bacterium]|nr:DnaJ domain-containing protein [Alphaproteobacteria bacterium]